MDSDQLGLFTKTSPESSTQKTTPSGASSLDLPVRTLLSLPPIQGSPARGRVLACSKDPRGGGRGVFSMLNTSEAAACTVAPPCPSAGSASLLSRVLERTDVPVPLRHFLSREAKDGILRRAKRRGRALPPMLEAALKA